MRIFAAATLALFALPAYAAPWVIDPASTLTFTGAQAGESFTGSFTKFMPVVEFDPAKPETGKITVIVNTGSAVVADDDEKTESLPTEDWFHVKQFPIATFISTRITSLSSKPNSYIAEGDLTLRGVTQKVALPFTLKEEAGRMIADGSVELNRSKFSVGQGQWKDDKWIAFPVSVKFHLIATKG